MVKSVLITGCSEGGLGAAMAVAFQQAGLRVYATARDVSKMATLKSAGIETLTLDVTSAQSIAAAVAQISSLDILVNNAGVSASMPIADLNLDDAKKVFDVNVWAQLQVTQAFLPLLLESNGMIINQTSIVAVIAGPFHAAYHASKAAISMFSECLRLELEPFGVKVVELKTGGVATNIIKTQNATTPITLPTGSIYAPASDTVEAAMRHDKMADFDFPADQWAQEVVSDVLRKNPPLVIWRGAKAGLVRIASCFPHGMMDSAVKKMAGLDVVAQRVKK